MINNIHNELIAMIKYPQGVRGEIGYLSHGKDKDFQFIKQRLADTC